MATITKTFTEDTYNTNKSTWTLIITQADITVSASSFTLSPTCTATYTSSVAKGYACAGIMTQIAYGNFTPQSYDDCFSWYNINNDYSRPSWAKSTTKTLPYKQMAGNYDPYTLPLTIQTNKLFTASNKTSKTATIQAAGYQRYLGESGTSPTDTSTSTNYNAGGDSGWNLFNNTLATVTLNVPPTVTLGTPTYSTPHYAGLGSYSVPITQAKAYYGGDISKVTLTVGQDSTVNTYSASTISSETISVTPTVAGTYTPTITVEDSRGQTKTETLSDIVVNPYLEPSLDFDVARTDNNGVRDDEGAYGLITANISFTDVIADITKPTVQINGTITNNVVWYSTYNASTGVSSVISDWTTVSSGDTVYGLINGSFAQTTSYQITITLTDSLGGTSSAITQTLSTAFYTIDFQAGGKEIAFGLPANDNLTSYPNGLFKCGMDAIFSGDVTNNGDVEVNGSITANGDSTFTTGKTEIEKPYYSLDTTAASGTDHDLYAAITALGWQSDVIE